VPAQVFGHGNALVIGQGLGHWLHDAGGQRAVDRVGRHLPQHRALRRLLDATRMAGRAHATVNGLAVGRDRRCGGQRGKPDGHASHAQREKRACIPCYKLSHAASEKAD
jgi:hypothetical protein